MKNHRPKVTAMIEGMFSRDADKEMIVDILRPRSEAELKKRAEVKYRRKWTEEWVKRYEKEVLTVERCAAAAVHSNISDRAYDRYRNTIEADYSSGEDEYKPVLVTVVEGQPGVRGPRKVSAKTIKRHRKKKCKELGIKLLASDGSSVQACGYKESLRRRCKAYGRAKCVQRMESGPLESMLRGDAHGTHKRKKMTHFTSSLIGTFKDDNSPHSLMALVHYQGGDDWENMVEQCRNIHSEQREVEREGGVTVNFDDGQPPLFVKIRQLWGGDGAIVDAEEGGGGFAVDESCFTCRCPKKHLGDDNMTHDRKDIEYLNNSSHLPIVWPLDDPADFVGFSCPHCNKHFPTLESVEEEDEIDLIEDAKSRKSKQGAFKKQHAGQMQKHYKLVPFSSTWTLMCLLHFFMNSVGHIWKHGVTRHFTGTDAAYTDRKCLALTTMLKTNCKVTFEVKKITKTLLIDNAKLPQIGGAAAKKVAEFFPLFLETAIFFEGKDKGDEVKIKQYNEAKNVMDALIDLWNTCNAEMEEESPGMPPKVSVRDAKATELDLLTSMYRNEWAIAFGQTQKPYTHMSQHIGDMQRVVRYDLMRYATQGQEHVGKVYKSIVKHGTNGILYAADDLCKDGRRKCGYVQQMTEKGEYAAYLRRIHNKRPTEHQRMVEKRQKAQIPKEMIAVKAQFTGHVPVHLETKSERALADGGMGGDNDIPVFHIIPHEEITPAFIAEWTRHADATDNTEPTGKKLRLGCFVATQLKPEKKKGRVVCVLRRDYGDGATVSLRIMRVGKLPRVGKQLESVVMVTPKAELRKGYARELLYKVIQNRRSIGIGNSDSKVITATCSSVRTRPWFDSLPKKQPAGMRISVSYMGTAKQKSTVVLRWTE